MRDSGHQYLYDFEELALRLREAGFGDVRRLPLGESDDPALRDLETPSRQFARRGGSIVIPITRPELPPLEKSRPSWRRSGTAGCCRTSGRWRSDWSR